jgi:hypothetical protein
MQILVVKGAIHNTRKNGTKNNSFLVRYKKGKIKMKTTLFKFIIVDFIIKSRSESFCAKPRD